MIIDNKLYCKYNLNMKKEYDLSTMKLRPNPYTKTNILTDFDIADYLDSKEAIAEYLSQVLADGDTDELLTALGHDRSSTKDRLRQRESLKNISRGYEA